MYKYLLHKYIYYLRAMLRSYKHRLYPTKAQTELLNRHFGACRFLYNLALETRNYAYAAHKKTFNYYDLAKQLTDLKKECVWLNEVSSQALQQSLIDLDTAFGNFFKGRGKYPNFKKKSNRQSFRIPVQIEVDHDNGKIYLPKFRDGIKTVYERTFEGEIRRATVSKTPTGKYFVSVLVETGKPVLKQKKVKEETSIGIDLGIKDFIVTSDGNKINNPKYLVNSLQRLKVLQRRVSRKKKGSSNRKKAVNRLAVLHERVANQRKDFLHKVSTQLVNSHDTLVFETLNIQGMVQNRKLAKSISDAGWGLFVDLCKYKSSWSGKNVLQIGTFAPSTKMCNCCGATNNTLTLADREWLCAGCGTLHDRDENAAKNIKSFGLRDYIKSGRGTPAELAEVLAKARPLKQELKVKPINR